MGFVRTQATSSGSQILLDASDVDYTPAGTGAVARTVKSKLDEFVSVTDFGTDLDAVQLAVDEASSRGGGTVYITNGTYSGTTILSVPVGVIVQGLSRNVDGSNGVILHYTGTGFGFQTTNGAGFKDIVLKSDDDGVRLWGIMAFLDNCAIIGNNTASSIGLQFSDGTVTNPSYYCRVTNTKVKKFKEMLEFNRYANGNYIADSWLHNTVSDGSADHFITMTNAIINQVQCGIDGDCNSSNNAIVIKSTTGVSCYGNTITGYHEITGALNEVEFDGTDCYHNTIDSPFFRQANVAYTNVRTYSNKVNYRTQFELPNSNFELENSLNLITNANLDYEVSGALGLAIDGWSKYSGATVTLSDDGTTLYGYKAIKVTNSDHAGLDYALSADQLERVKGKVITFFVYLKTAEANNMRISINDDVNSMTSTAYNFGNASGDWEMASITVPISSTATSASLRFDGKDPGAGWNFYFAIPGYIIGSELTDTIGNPVLDNGATKYSRNVKKIYTLENDATPTVRSGSLWLTGGTTTITDFDDGVEGQEITILSEHAITITDGTNIFLNGSANFVMASTDTLTLIQKADGKWYEKSRSVN